MPHIMVKAFELPSKEYTIKASNFTGRLLQNSNITTVEIDNDIDSFETEDLIVTLWIG